MILYIAGPMTGLPDSNYPAFHAAAQRLRDAGYDVLNPADNPKPENRSNPGAEPEWLDWMRAALHQVAEADGVALLPDWEASRGARVEVRLALSLGLDVRTVHAWQGGERHE